MEFVAGKFYRTRVGKKLFFIGKNEFVDYDDERYVFSEQDGTLWSTTRNGVWNRDRSPSDNDIIGEWQEPVTVTHYWFAYVRPDGSKGSEIYVHKTTAEGQREILARNKGFRFSHIEEITTVVP